MRLCIVHIMSERSDRLIVARKRRFEHAHEAADDLKVPRSTWYQYEDGRRDYLKHARRFARFFGVNYNWLAHNIGTMEGHPVLRIYDELKPDAQRSALEFLEFLKSRSPDA